ncbi:hypothetical protein J2W51_004008 [Tardiphaga robiniae]|nr:hypothetical protein [Tardiphaga robiniae]
MTVVRTCRIAFNAPLDAPRSLRVIDHASSSEATHSISISIAGLGSA